MRPKKPCNKVGCASLVQPPERYCQKHRWSDAQRAQYETERRQAIQREYDRQRRDPKATAFYRSPDWERLRAHVLERDNHLCVLCLNKQQMTPANTVDHIVPIRVDWSKRLDPDNCRSLCPPCHNRRRSEGQSADKTPPGVEKFLQTVYGTDPGSSARTNFVF